MNKTTPSKVKKIKGWVVEMRLHQFNKWKIVREGWGTNNDWIFRTKWIAMDAIEEHLRDEYEGKLLRIVRCEIIYKIPPPKHR